MGRRTNRPSAISSNNQGTIAQAISVLKAGTDSLKVQGPELAKAQVTAIDQIIKNLGDNGEAVLSSWLAIQIKSKVANLIGVFVTDLIVAGSIRFLKADDNVSPFYIWKAQFVNKAKNWKIYNVRWHTHIPGEFASPEPCLRVGIKHNNLTHYLVENSGEAICVRVENQRICNLFTCQQGDLTGALAEKIFIDDSSKGKHSQREKKIIWACTDPRSWNDDRDLVGPLNKLSHIPFVPIFNP